MTRLQIAIVTVLVALLVPVFQTYAASEAPQAAGQIVAKAACPTGTVQCGKLCTNLGADPSNCGACRRVCATGQTCSNGTCVTAPPACPTNTTLCSGVCTNLGTDLRNCGGCGVTCSLLPNSFSSCTAGACGFNCVAGFANCNGILPDGCETNLSTSQSNCGACGLVCGAGQACTQGVCFTLQ